MKKLFALSFCLFIISINLISQENQKRFALAGYLSFNTYKSTIEGNNKQESTENYIYLGPRVAYYLNKNLLTGIRIGFMNSKTEETDGDNTYTFKENMMEFSPFIRYYAPISERVNFYGDLMLSYSFGKREGEETRDKTTSFGTRLIPGISFDVSECISLEASIGGIGYNYEKNKPDEANTRRQESTSQSFSIFADLEFVMLGVQINL